MLAYMYMYMYVIIISALLCAVCVCVCVLIPAFPVCQDVPLCIKWPNDIYYRDKVKLGGVLVTCFSVGRATTTAAVIG